MLIISGWILVFSACSGGSDSSEQAEVPLYTDVLTLETAMEDDPSLDVFQIVDPSGIGVDSEGNIYLADEHSLKVYKPDGTPLKIIGREGAGPGEFIAPFSVKYRTDWNYRRNGCSLGCEYLRVRWRVPRSDQLPER